MEPLLNVFRYTEHIYYLNKTGRLAVGAEKEVTKAGNWTHTLMRNDIYIHYGCPEIWENEFEVKDGLISFFADAVFMAGGQAYFLEVDNQQKMKENKDKLLRYKAFKDGGRWQKSHNGNFPFLLFYTSSEARKAQIREMSPPGLDLKVLTSSDLY